MCRVQKYTRFYQRFNPCWVIVKAGNDILFTDSDINRLEVKEVAKTIKWWNNWRQMMNDVTYKNGSCLALSFKKKNAIDLLSAVVLLIDYRTSCCSFHTFPFRRYWCSYLSLMSPSPVNSAVGTSIYPRRIRVVLQIPTTPFAVSSLSYPHLHDPCGNVRRFLSCPDGFLCHICVYWICCWSSSPFVQHRSCRNGCI